MFCKTSKRSSFLYQKKSWRLLFLHLILLLGKLVPITSQVLITFAELLKLKMTCLNFLNFLFTLVTWHKMAWLLIPNPPELFVLAQKHSVSQIFLPKFFVKPYKKLTIFWYMCYKQSSGFYTYFPNINEAGSRLQIRLRGEY